MMTTTTAPSWLRRSDQAVTWARGMLSPHRAVVIDCETTDLPDGGTGGFGYLNPPNSTRCTAMWAHRSWLRREATTCGLTANVAGDGDRVKCGGVHLGDSCAACCDGIDAFCVAGEGLSACWAALLVLADEVGCNGGRPPRPRMPTGHGD